MKILAFGLVGAVVAALLWGGIAYLIHMESGWVAWGVGFLVGVAVALGNDTSRWSSTAAGVLAVALTVVSVVGGKFVAVRMLLPSDEQIVDLFVETFDDTRLMLTLLATDVFNELSDAGRLFPEPEGAKPLDDFLPEGIPREVWLEAQRRWDAFSDAERKEHQDRISRQLGQAMLPSLRMRMTLFGFLGSFSWQDLLFFAFALGTAFKVGSGRTHFEESPPTYEREAGSGDHPPTTPVSQRRVDEKDLEREPGAVSYCPGCGGQFRAGIGFCSDCGTVLAPFLGDV